MRQHQLIILTLLCIAAGCASKTEPVHPGLISGQAFVKVWEHSVTTPRDPVTQIYIREDRVIAYTKSHLGVWLSAAEGTFLNQYPIASGDRAVHPPVTLADSVLIPTTLSLESFTKNGRFEQSYPMPSAVQSPAVGYGRAIFFSLSHEGSGRLTRYNLTDRGLSFVWAMYTEQGIVSSPVVLNDAVYAGGNDGKVWAINGNRDALWSLPGGLHTFQTNGKITADLAIDDFGVYVASQDKRLYCIDRTSGKIRWAYYASNPLLDQPFVTAAHVYQLVPNVGLVAIDKTEGKLAREPLWVQPLAQQVVSVDEKNVYVRSGGALVALSRATGEPVFRSTRQDGTAFATNMKTSTIYVATQSGSIMAIQPVLKPGTVGELAFEETLLEPLAAAR